MSSGWTVVVGDTLGRRARLADYGGGLYGGIEPSSRSPNVFLYSDPRRGMAYGYNYDGWSADGTVFLYTGEGRRGPQHMTHGNAAILHHREQGRTLRLFVADGREPGSTAALQRYVGEFAISTTNAYVVAEANDVRGALRTVYVFRLEPVGDVLRRPEDFSASGDVAEELEAAAVPVGEAAPSPAVADAVPLEAVKASTYAVAATSGTTATRTEAELVARFQQHLSAGGSSCVRYKLRPPGELRVLYTDLLDETQNVLYEAKGDATRDAVRMALGQLLDYSRHIPTEPALAVLLPQRPAADLIDLLARHNVVCFYEEAPGVFTVAASPSP
jgi:hypothetical protein